MFIHFDKAKMHVQIICGILEKYEPTENIQVIQQKVEKLKEQIHNFMAQVVDVEVKEIDKLISEENSKYTKSEEK